MVEFRPRDLMQVIVGASLLAVPVAFTEETWNLGAELPIRNVLFLSDLSLLFIGLFVYFNFYRNLFREHVIEYIKRVVSIYLFSLLIVALLLSIIERCPWGVDKWLVIKRILIVAFPASMSAAVVDTLKCYVPNRWLYPAAILWRCSASTACYMKQIKTIHRR